jgi:hypothetical protein
MPTYSVRLIVNVPGMVGGDRAVDQAGIVAQSIEDAIKQAKANIVMRPTQVQETAFP